MTPLWNQIRVRMSRSCQVNIAKALETAGLAPGDISGIVTGVGPAPFTGLRAGIVAAKAIAFATGAKLVGQNILEPQAWWNAERHGSADDGLRVLTLAVNDARRKQLYFELCQPASPDDAAHDARPLIAMDIDYPANIVERVNDAVAAYERRFDGRVVVDVVGHGAAKYSDALASIQLLGDIVDESVLDQGAHGLGIFARRYDACDIARGESPVEPLYLRRPDAEVPNPLKHVLGHGGVKAAR